MEQPYFGAQSIWSNSEKPDDLSKWPRPASYFTKASHLLKLWSFNPNFIPHFLVPEGSHEAGFYPLNKSGEKGQFYMRNNIMKKHNDNPSFLAYSTFPNKLFVSKADETKLDALLNKKIQNKINNNKKKFNSGLNTMKETKQLTATNMLQEAPNTQHTMEKEPQNNSDKPTDPSPHKKMKTSQAQLKDPPAPPNKLKNEDVVDWLAKDFIDMFLQATGLKLKMVPFQKEHIDPRLGAGNTKVPLFPNKRNVFKQGGKICLYCEKCWDRELENPVCFLSINLKDNDDLSLETPEPKHKGDDVSSQKQPSQHPRVKAMYCQQFTEEGNMNNKVFQGVFQQSWKSNNDQLEIQPTNYQQDFPDDPFRTGQPKQKKNYGPAVVERPNYLEGEGVVGRSPENLTADDVGSENDCWDNELMQRSTKYSHISLTVSELYYHSLHCEQHSNTSHLQSLKKGEFVDISYNPEFVLGPTYDQAYNVIQKVPLSSVTLQDSTTEEDATKLREIYKNVDPPLLEVNAEGKVEKSEEQLKRDTLHDKFTQTHYLISVDKKEENIYNDRTYSPGPYHENEFPVGRFYQFVSNARFNYNMVLQFGSERDCSPFLFNHHLYAYLLLDAPSNSVQLQKGQPSAPFAHYWIRNPHYHIYLSSVSLIFGGNEKLVSSSLIKHQTKHRDCVYTFPSNSTSHTWDSDDFPPSSGLLPFTTRKLISYDTHKNDATTLTINRGTVTTFNGEVWHGGATYRGIERGWYPGLHIHFDSTKAQRTGRQLEVASSLDLPQTIPGLSQLRNENDLSSIHHYLTDLTRYLQDACLYITSDDFMQLVGENFYKNYKKEDFQHAANIVYALYLVSRLGKMLDTRLLPPQPQQPQPQPQSETHPQHSEHSVDCSNTVQWLYQNFTNKGTLHPATGSILENQQIWNQVFDNQLNQTKHKEFLDGNTLLYTNISEALPTMLAPPTLLQQQQVPTATSSQQQNEECNNECEEDTSTHHQQPQQQQHDHQQSHTQQQDSNQKYQKDDSIQ
jgi:hypothetical protein